MTDDQILEVVQAHKEGKKLEFCHNEGCVHYWYDFCGDPSWNFEKFTYRVAPEPRKPREFWLIREPSELRGDMRFRAYQCHQKGVDWEEQIHVREVLE